MCESSYKGFLQNFQPDHVTVDPLGQGNGKFPFILHTMSFRGYHMEVHYQKLLFLVYQRLYSVLALAWQNLLISQHPPQHTLSIGQ